MSTCTKMSLLTGQDMYKAVHDLFVKELQRRSVTEAREITWELAYRLCPILSAINHWKTTGKLQTYGYDYQDSFTGDLQYIKPRMTGEVFREQAFFSATREFLTSKPVRELISYAVDMNEEYDSYDDQCAHAYDYSTYYEGPYDGKRLVNFWLREKESRMTGMIKNILVGVPLPMVSLVNDQYKIHLFVPTNYSDVCVDIITWDEITQGRFNQVMRTIVNAEPDVVYVRVWSDDKGFQETMHHILASAAADNSIRYASHKHPVVQFLMMDSQYFKLASGAAIDLSNISQVVEECESYNAPFYIKFGINHTDITSPVIDALNTLLAKTHYEKKTINDANRVYVEGFQDLIEQEIVEQTESADVEVIDDEQKRDHLDTLALQYYKQGFLANISAGYNPSLLLFEMVLFETRAPHGFFSSSRKITRKLFAARMNCLQMALEHVLTTLKIQHQEIERIIERGGVPKLEFQTISKSSITKEQANRLLVETEEKIQYFSIGTNQMIENLSLAQQHQIIQQTEVLNEAREKLIRGGKLITKEALYEFQKIKWTLLGETVEMLLHVSRQAASYGRDKKKKHKKTQPDDDDDDDDDQSSKRKK